MRVVVAVTNMVTVVVALGAIVESNSIIEGSNGNSRGRGRVVTVLPGVGIAQHNMERP